MKVIRKISSVLITLTMVLGNLTFPVNAGKDFDAYLKDEFSDLIGQSYMDSHFAMKDSSAYLSSMPEAVYGEVSWSDYEKDTKDYQKRLDRLHEYDRDSLNEDQKNEYDTYEFYLENSIAMNQSPYMDFAFVPSGSVIESIETNLSEFVFRKKQDFDDYLSVVESIPDYLDECMELTEKQAEKGYFLTDTQLKEICSIIESFTSETDDNALIVSFKDATEASTDLSENEKHQYIEKNSDLILNKIIPSFTKTEERLKKLKGSRKGGNAMADLDGGKEYYAALARTKTGMDADVDELLETCTSYLKDVMNQYMDLMSQQDTSFVNETVDLGTPEEILEYLKKNMKDLPALDDVKYTVSYLDPSIASPSVSAYYVTPPVDDLSNNVVKINGDNVSDVNDLYSTLAHEGFPGHLYQTVEYYSHDSISPLRYITDPIGYTEGWAMYAETLGWSVAPVSKNAAAMQCVSITMNYVLDAAADLGVNGLGWSVHDLEKYLDDLGFNSEIAQDLYDFVTLQPGVILPYGYGVAKFLTLRQKVRTELGDDYSVSEFNECILKGGARPFQKVEADVDQMLKEHGVSVEKTEEHSNVWLIAGCVALILACAGIVIYRKRGRKR